MTVILFAVIINAQGKEFVKF